MKQEREVGLLLGITTVEIRTGFGSQLKNTMLYIIQTMMEVIMLDSLESFKQFIIVLLQVSSILIRED